MRAWTATSRRASEPPLGREELQLEWALGGALALLSTWAVFFFDLSGTALLPFTTAAVLAGFVWPRLPARLPTWGRRLVFPALLGFVAVDWVLNREPLAVAIRLNVLLVAVRAVGPRRRREDLQLIVLCLLLVVVAGVLTVSIGFAVLILVFTALALADLLVITLAAAVRGEGEESAEWTRVPWRRLARRLWRVMDWRFVGVAGTLFVLVVAVATGLFLALPRFQLENSLGFLQLRNRRSLTGFSDSVRLGEVTDIAQDPTTALRAEVSDPARAPVQRYWRMVVLDGCREGGFRVTRGAAREARAVAESRSVEGRAAREAVRAPVWTCYFEPGVSRYLPLLGNFTRLRLREAQALGVNERTRVYALKEEPQTMFAYRVEGMESGDRVADPGLAAELAARPVSAAGGVAAGGPVSYPQTLLEVPPGEANRAVLDRLVREITGGEELAAEAFARRATVWLAGRHRYATRLVLPAGPEDPFVRWLASAEPGHCEIFAGGLALLARHAGHPARLVTGFKGGAWNAFEGYFMVRNSDAHAWCEVFDGQGEWFRVDPTPGATVGGAETAMPGRGGEVDRSWTARFDSLRMLWYRRIVDFDRRAQVEVFEGVKRFARGAFQGLIARIDRVGQAVRNWLLRPWNLRRGVGWAVALLGVGGVLGVAWRFRFAWWGRWRRGKRGDPVRRQAGRWLRRIEAAGAGAHDTALVRDLQRLRYGAATRRPDPLAVFGRARHVLLAKE